MSHIVHRDLKPANVLLREGRWNVADFGIARFVEDSTSARTLKDCLSPQFAAPEQWRYERSTGATDVYALGGVLHVMLTGRPPFDGSAVALQEMHLSAVPPEIPSESGQLKALVSMMLRKTPAARPSLSRVQTLLTQALGSFKAVSDPAFGRLASAGAEYERRQLEAESERNRLETLWTQRSDLAVEARGILNNCFEELSRRISVAVPNARLQRIGTSWIVQVAHATLEMNAEADPLIAEGRFARSNWDVICGGAIEVRQVQPVHKRGASLWYTRQKSRSADFRWYEVGYTANYLSGKAFEFEPVALDAENADRAHGQAMDVVQTAYHPTPVDDEDSEMFFRRWAHILALAAEGKLKTLPSSLPTAP